MKKKIKKQFHKVKVMHNKNNNFCMLQFQMNPMEDPFQGVVSVKKLVKFFFLIIANAILKFKSKQSKMKVHFPLWFFLQRMTSDATSIENPLYQDVTA